MWIKYVSVMIVSCGCCTSVVWYWNFPCTPVQSTGIFLAHQFRVLEFSLHTSSEYWNFPCTPVQSTGIFLAHQFRVLEIFTVCSFVVGCWTNGTNMGTKWCCWSRKNVACQERQHSRCIIIVFFKRTFENKTKTFAWHFKQFYIFLDLKC